MAKKSYIVFKDLRAFWDKKTDTIRLTSGDPDLSAQGWSLTLNRASKDEQILRDALTDAGVIPPDRRSPGFTGEYLGTTVGKSPDPVFFNAEKLIPNMTANKSKKASEDPVGLPGADAITYAEQNRQNLLQPPVNKNTLQWIRTNISILDFLEDQHIWLRPTGKMDEPWVGLCPIHNEKVPSFRVNTKTNTFHCYGCARSGDIITLVQDMENISFVGAVQKLVVYKNLDLAALETDPDYQQAARADDIQKRVAERREYEAAKNAGVSEQPFLKAGEAPDEEPLPEPGAEGHNAWYKEIEDAGLQSEGSYLGHTTRATRTPLWFDPFEQINQNRAPGVMITGAPGSGKSFLAFKLAYDLTLRGVQTIYLDPKGDAMPLTKMKGMETARLVDIREGYNGYLDPLRGIDKAGFRRAEQYELTMSTLSLLLGSRLAGGFDSKARNLIALTVEEIAIEPNPSFNALLARLKTKGETDQTALALHLELKLFSELPFGRLLFGEYKGKDILFGTDLTLVTMLGLDLPDARTPQAAFSASNSLAITIMTLMANKIRGSIIDAQKGAKKAVIIDEAATLLEYHLGQKILIEISRMGRSLNTSLILTGQIPAAFNEGHILNMLPTRFAFRTAGPEQIDTVLGLLSLAKNNFNRNAVRNLRNGECMILRPGADVTTVQIASTPSQLREAFDTNPETRKK